MWRTMLLWKRSFWGSIFFVVFTTVILHHPCKLFGAAQLNTFLVPKVKSIVLFFTREHHFEICIWHGNVKVAYLDVTVVHEDPLKVEKSSCFEDFRSKCSDIVVSHSQDLNVRIQVRWNSSKACTGTIRFPLAIGPFTMAILKNR